MYEIIAQYQNGQTEHLPGYHTLKDAEHLVALYESDESNYNVIYTIKEIVND